MGLCPWARGVVLVLVSGAVPCLPLSNSFGFAFESEAEYALQSMPTQPPNGIAMHKRATLIKATDTLVGQTLASLRREIVLVYHPELAGLWVALGFFQTKKNSWVLGTVDGPFYSLGDAVSYTAPVKRIEWIVVPVRAAGGEC